MTLTHRNFRYSQRAATALNALSDSDRQQVFHTLEAVERKSPAPSPGILAKTKRLADGTEVKVLRAGPRLRVFVSDADRQHMMVEEISDTEMLRSYFGWTE